MRVLAEKCGGDGGLGLLATKISTIAAHKGEILYILYV